MENTFTLPERPWGEADVKFLFEHAGMLDEATRAELGIVDTPAIEEEVADVVVDADEVPAAPVEEVTPEVVAPTEEVPVGLPTDVDGAVENPVVE